MKRKTLALIGVLIISLLSLTVATSCDKDTDCKLKVYTVKKSNGRSVPGAHVSVYKSGGTIGAYGYTDASGVFEAKFSAPAIFDVVVFQLVQQEVEYNTTDSTGTTHSEKDVEYVGLYRASTTVRLKDGEEVSKTITLDDASLIRKESLSEKEWENYTKLWFSNQ